MLDVRVIGGGFSGLYQLDRLRDLGYSVQVWDSADDLGGVWWRNCYPGARTDSTGQVYHFERKDLWKKYDFSEPYPNWEGVRDYIHFLDRELGLRKDIEFSTFAKKAAWDEDTDTWTVTSSDGKQARARQVLVATGFGSKHLYPKIEGLDNFHARMKYKEKAELVAPAEWPHPWRVERPSLEQDYYDILDQDNVEIVNWRAKPILEVVPEGVVT